MCSIHVSCIVICEEVINVLAFKRRRVYYSLSVTIVNRRRVYYSLSVMIVNRRRVYYSLSVTIVIDCCLSYLR